MAEFQRRFALLGDLRVKKIEIGAWFFYP